MRYGASAPIVTQRGMTVTMADGVENPSAIDPARLFERFYQADASRTGPGSGLGLAVVANLTHAMDTQATADVVDYEFRIRLEFPAGSEKTS